MAINRRDFRVPDNAGRRPRRETIVRGAGEFLPATWPAARVLAALRRAGVPARESLDAGRHCCNHILFEALWLARTEGLPTRCGFLHLPFLEAQVVELDRDEPSMSPASLRVAVLAVVQALLA
jgi:pyroglutamyl-peptidase